jgi:hypothetical protein
MRSALIAIGFAILACGPVLAQSQQGALVRQDFSDCSNGNVRPDEGGGTVYVVRGTDGTTSVKVAITAKPNTTYHFYLKCVQILGDIMTDDKGVGVGLFTFQAAQGGNVLAFEMYPDGAPLGNKFQSVQIRF